MSSDGTARELHASERQYLETEFRGGDGAMPYIKNSYSERDGWSEISSYLKRSELPAGTLIHHARPKTRAGLSAELNTSHGCATKA